MRARVFSSPNSQTKPATMNRLTAVVDVDDHKKPKLKKQAKQPENGCFESLDENLLFEIHKQSNVRTLSAATCVNKQWRRVVEDERLWELIYKRDWTDLGEDTAQWLEFVVHEHGGGFRRLHTHPMF
ncbi:hypothetical protein Droror1_Dr00013681 [Drosera rotundifolia]